MLAAHSKEQQVKKLWLYAASKALASEAETLSLAYESGFIWRSFYNESGNRIACVKDISSGDDLILGYRDHGIVRLLARFRIGRPDKRIDESAAFGIVPPVWAKQFRDCGYSNDPKLKTLVGIFVEEVEPLSGHLAYAKNNSLSRLEPVAVVAARSARLSSRPLSSPVRPRLPPLGADNRLDVEAPSTTTGPLRDGIHVGIDVGGRPDKGFDLCITEWSGGLLADACWARVPHSTPLPSTSSLRAFVCDGELSALADATYTSAAATAADLWRELARHHPGGIYVDSPSAFSRNQLGHGRLCEKASITGVSFQSTPSLACGSEHGGDWGWLVYGMVAFAACLHCGELGEEEWMAVLENGTHARFNSPQFLLRECFPTATISVLRAHNREADVSRALSRKADLPAVGAVLDYLERGVKAVKQPRKPLYDQADALVAALGALPHVAEGFRELPNWPAASDRWQADPGDEDLEGTFICVA